MTGLEPRAIPRQSRTKGTDPVVDRSKIHEDIRQLREMHRRQVQFYKKEQAAIATILGYGPDFKAGVIRMPESQLIMLRAGLQQLTEASLRARLEEIDVFLARITKGALHAARAQELAVASNDDAQLRATMREEFLRAAHTFTPEEWAHLDEVRRVQASKGGGAALLVTRGGMRKLLRDAKARERDEDKPDEESDDE